jgi:hypothetical protein
LFRHDLSIRRETPVHFWVAGEARANRGRDTRCRVPPAQTRTCGTTASGSYLGFWRRSAAASRTRPSALVTLSRLCVRCVFCPARFPLVTPLPSTPSATASAVLFRCFAGTTGVCDFSCSFISGLRPWPFPHGLLAFVLQATTRSLGSRARSGSCTCSRSSTPPDPTGSRDIDPVDVAFRVDPRRRHLGALFSGLDHACLHTPG